MKQTDLVSGSPETQQLLDLCVAIVKGERNYLSVLRERCAFRLQEMYRANQHFFGQVDRMGEEHATRFAPELEEVSLRFREYEAALLGMQSCIDTGAPGERMWELGTSLAQASHFLRVAVGRYEQAELSVGPSKFPIVNIMDNLGKQLREGRAPEVWAGTCAQYMQYYRKMLEEIQKSEQRNGPGVPEREKTLEWIVSLFTQMAMLGPDHLEGRLSRILAELTTAHLDLERCFTTYNEAILTREPTRSPAINLVLNTVAGFREGRFTVDAMRQVVEGYLEIVRTGIQDLQPALQSQSESAVLSENAAQMLEAMESVEDALGVLLELAENPNLDATRVEGALVRLREAGDKGATATAEVREFNESAGKVACIHCSTMNEMSNRVCKNCGRPMPLAHLNTGHATMEIREGAAPRSAVGPDFTQESVMTDVIKNLFDQCEAYEKGEIEAQTLLTTLGTRESEIRQAEEKLKELKSPEIPPEAEGAEREISQEFVRMADDALDLLEVGLGQCQQGLDMIRQAIETGNLDLMDEGRESYYEGCQKMWEVWRLDNAMDNYLAEGEADEEVDASG